MTYVSLDEKSTHKDWNAMMRKENILWRSLMTDTPDAIRERYYVYGVPRMFLVYPGGKKMQRIDIRLEKDRTLLYELIGNYR